MDENYAMPDVHYFPGGRAFFSSFGNPKMRFNKHWGMFVKTEGPNKLPDDNIYITAIDHWDLPITALLISF